MLLLLLFSTNISDRNYPALFMPIIINYIRIRFQQFKTVTGYSEAKLWTSYKAIFSANQVNSLLTASLNVDW